MTNPARGWSPSGLVLVILGVACTPVAARPADGAAGPSADGHTRPRALALDARGDLLYVALSTANRLAVIDVAVGPARPVAELPICAFPDALAPLPGGGVVVGCRFDPRLRVVSRRPTDASLAPRFSVRAVEAGREHGNRGLAVDAGGRFAYVGAPPLGGVRIVDLVTPGATPRFVPTGLFPQTVRIASATPGGRALLLVSNFVGRAVTLHDIRPDGGLSPAVQTIRTEAPVLDLALAPAAAGVGELRGALLLATHEDRPLSRERISVEGLDSVLLVLPRASAGASLPFVDPGAGKRTTLNLTERVRSALVGLDVLLVDGTSGRVAVAGAGSDNVLVSALDQRDLLSGAAVAVGAHPSALAFLPGGGVASADRLSDTVTLVPGAGPTQTVVVGFPGRTSPAERGELLFYSRALVPNNVSEGALSIYTCAACHADGHVDGRLHPSKRNRFYSTTQTCRGLVGTEPFLTLGKPETFAAFADNIVSTHAQGALDAPETFDRYPVDLRVRARDAWTTVTLSAAQLRTALAAYMKSIPVEPSPFVQPGRRALTAEERRGLAIFRENCAGCHRLAASAAAPSTRSETRLEAALLEGRVALTNPRLYDVGTPVLGEGGNNPPSLRGVWAAAPYFSDGSAASLDDVISRTNPGSRQVHAPENAQGRPAFSPSARAELLAFLRAL